MKVAAPAKINLTLEVTGIEENGYHTLDTIFCWLDLEDSLELTKSDEETFLSMESSDVSLDGIELNESNLILRAHRAVEKRVGATLPTKYQLWKRIPSGGGLGGGSADAAAALVGLNGLYQLGLSHRDLLELARPLGADVSFGLLGGAARGTRYGDILEPVRLPSFLLERPLFLLFPEFGCPTPKVYGLWDRQQSRVAQGSSQKFLEAVEPSSLFGWVRNDLEEPAFELHPPLRAYKQKMEEAGLVGCCLSGSGSTLFGFLPEEGDVGKMEQALSTLDVRVVTTKLKEEARIELVS